MILYYILYPNSVPGCLSFQKIGGGRYVSKTLQLGVPPLFQALAADVQLGRRLLPQAGAKFVRISIHWTSLSQVTAAGAGVPFSVAGAGCASSEVIQELCNVMG